MVGYKLGHYRIVEEIGKGGMGEVYRARDEHLDRDVAVKVLPAGTLADEAARQRFRREALALGKLNHPNIQSVFDFDTQEGVDFLVTEYVPGVTLSDKLAAGPLPEKEEVRLGTQLAEGLAAAHAQGILHRDLKPSNLRVTPDGRLKILDFGVAKLLGPVSETAVTETGTRTVAGTPLYMSPEQRRGERADARSDLYSAGLVLWEMATGKPPSVAARGLSGRATPELQRIVEKCLEEDPENRYQSAKELAVDLRRLVAPAATAEVSKGWRLRPRWALAAGALVAVVALAVGLNVGGIRDRLLARENALDSIAVLPLKNLMGDPEQEYFVEGMHEALVTELSKIGALKVISRTSTMRYKETDKPLPQVARELNVDAVIEGSVLREGDQVRITVQLIHGPSDRHLWAENYQRELRNIIALQSEVARDIAREIHVTLTPGEATRLANARPVEPQAHELYLRGRFHWNKRTEEGLRKAVAYFQQALERDPTYASAYAGLADSYVVLGIHTGARPKDIYPTAIAAATKALEIDDTLAEAHTSLAYAKDMYEWDWAGAEKQFKRALELNANYATTHHWYALHWAQLGRVDEAVAEMKRAQQLDPLSLVINTNLARMLTFQRNYNQAIELYRKVLEMDPNFSHGRRSLGWTYAQMGRYDEAISEFQRAATLSGDGVPQLAPLGYAYGMAGRRKEALRILQALQERSRREYVEPLFVAQVYLGLGEKDQALARLEAAYEERSLTETFLKGSPVFDPLRSDPRFQDLLRRMNFPE